MNEYIDAYANRKSVLIGLAVIVVLVFSVLGYLYFRGKTDGLNSEDLTADTANKPSVEEPSGALRPEEAIYLVEGEKIKLEGGYYEGTSATSTTAKTTVRVFGSPVFGDLDQDGDSDAALFLQRESGGSGVFYYAAAAVNEQNTYRGTEAFYLGDRIAPQTMSIRDKLVVANYAERKSNDPMTKKPSIAVSKYFVVFGSRLEETLPPGIQK